MGTTKTQEQVSKAPAPTTADQIKPAPELQGGPRRLRRRPALGMAPVAESLAPPAGAGDQQRAQTATAVQRTLGNARLARLFSGGGGVQAQLTVGPPHDRFEQEAEQVARRVVSGERVARIPRLAAGGLQPLTESPPAPSEEKVGAPEKTKQGQHQPDLERDGAIQRQAEASGGSIGGDGGLQESKTGLPDHLKAGIENLSGMAMDDVRVHYNSSKPAQVQASAYTQGAEIHVGPGQERHLPHEAWHVVQQMQGRVRPTVQARGVAINDDQGLEREADVMGAKVLEDKMRPNTEPGCEEGGGKVLTDLESDINLARQYNQHSDEQKGTDMNRGSTLQEKANTLLKRGARGQKASSYPLEGTISENNRGLVLQRAYELGGNTTLDHDHRAKKVRVEDIDGTPLGPAANSPKVSPFGWQELFNAGHTLANKSSTSSHYNAVRMHLWNGRLGGPGDQTWNLAPGPAKVNSMMSAGPEEAAKNLAEAGNKIWLETEVKYQKDSNNASDFTSVVPNHIEMKWGVMGNVGQSWSTNIDLPVAPLGGAEEAKYKNWDLNKPNELVVELGGKTEQVLAQVYDLVQHDNLKFAILKKYPVTYLSMTDAEKGKVLKKFTNLDSLWNFLMDDLKIPNFETVVREALIPLAEGNAPDRVQFLFEKFNDDEQRKMLIRYHDQLLPSLGPIGIKLSKSDYLIFTYNSDAAKAGLLNLMTRAEIKTLLNKSTPSIRKGVFDVWAMENGKTNPDEKAAFINNKLSVIDDTLRSWTKAYKDQMDAEIDSMKYKGSRPSRTKKQTARYRPY